MQMVPTRRLICFGSATAWLLRTTTLLAQHSIPTTLAPASTPAHQIFDLSIFVVAITGGIFLVVGGLLAIALFQISGTKDRPPGRASSDLRQHSNRIGVDSNSGVDCGRSVSNDCPNHIRNSGRTKAQDSP